MTRVYIIVSPCRPHHGECTRTGSHGAFAGKVLDRGREGRPLRVSWKVPACKAEHSQTKNKKPSHTYPYTCSVALNYLNCTSTLYNPTRNVLPQMSCSGTRTTRPLGGSRTNSMRECVLCRFIYPRVPHLPHHCLGHFARAQLELGPKLLATAIAYSGVNQHLLTA